MSFLGYPRQDGSVGSRNYIGIISTVGCANDVSWRIVQQVPGAKTFLHQSGCCQTQPDIDQTTRTLIALGRNPNLASVVLVSLGCESVSADEIEKAIGESGKPVKKVVIQKSGGASAAFEKGCHVAQAMVREAAILSREEFPDSALVLGIKCGASDATSGLAANPAIGFAVDEVINRGGACVFGETTEFIGAEHILAQRAANPAVAAKILDIVGRMESRALAMGADMRGGQPTAGNIAGGLTTIEEKSLGAIVKAGHGPISDVIEYGERPRGKGLIIVDTPGREPEFLTALAAAGAQAILFSTGLGAPQGFPFVPVVKITGNSATYRNLLEHIDILVAPGDDLESAGRAIFRDLLEVVSGKQTKAEITEYGNFPNVFTVGPIL